MSRKKEIGKGGVMINEIFVEAIAYDDEAGQTKSQLVRVYGTDNIEKAVDMLHAVPGNTMEAWTSTGGSLYSEWFIRGTGRAKRRWQRPPAD